MGTKIPRMGTASKARRKPARNRSTSVRLTSVRRRSTLTAALFSSTQERVLSLLFGQPARAFFTTELIALAKSGRGAVQRELKRLTEAGLVLQTRQGNQKYFRANHAAPIFAELRGIILKTVGLAEPLRAALNSLRHPPRLALVYGSVAKHADTASSDIDLLIVSNDLSLESLYAALTAAEEEISRKINVTLLTAAEFSQRKNDKSPFLSSVLAGDYLLLTGEIDGIGAA
jgi:predicted nucleotidyltransferase